MVPDIRRVEPAARGRAGQLSRVRPEPIRAPGDPFALKLRDKNKSPRQDGLLVLPRFTVLNPNEIVLCDKIVAKTPYFTTLIAILC